MQYNIRKKDAIRVVGIKMPLVEEYEENIVLIPQYWKQAAATKQFHQICELSNQEPYGVLGISAYFDPQHIFYYIAAATDQSVPDGLEEFKVPAATWCVVSGHPGSTYEDLFRGLVLDYLPFSEFEYVELPDIEVYPTYSKSKVVPIKEAWFPIKHIEK